MAMATLDSVHDAVLSVLAPGGVPVGTIKAVYKRNQDVPYRGLTPAVFLPPLSAPVSVAQIAAGRTIWQGALTLTYIDATPAQQALSLAAVEDALTNNLEALVAAILTNPRLGGAVTHAGPRQGGPAIDVTPNPDGFFRDDAGAMWVSFDITVPFLGK